ncbi:hypothetical protein F5887DRAFT_1158003 [Amanita rubescens]|nr:hypothetical protein F5887DRAFT_1158003 [Amanita rubescens]
MHRVVLRTCAIPRFNLSQLRTNSTNAAVKPRLVVEFDGLVIPSQRDVLPLENTAADSSSPRTLHTDHDSAVASLVWEAGNEQPPHDPIEQRRKARLAREAGSEQARQDATIEQRRKARLAREAGSEQARQDATIEQRRKARLAREAANNQLLQDPTIEQRREARLAREAVNKQPRQDPTIEQRRDARLAPEAANKQPRQDPTIEQRRDSRKTSPRQDPTIEQRREARLAREAANKQDHTIEQRREAHLALESSRHRQDPTITQRREERWDLEALMDTDNRRPSSKSDLRPHSSTGEKMPEIWDMDLFPAMAVDHGQSEGLDALGKFKARVNTADAKFRDSGNRNSGRGRPAFNASRTMT